jgi:hypothetical protein
MLRCFDFKFLGTFLAILLIALPLFSKEKWTIIPGKSVGPFLLGKTTVAEIRRELGPPKKPGEYPKKGFRLLINRRTKLLHLIEVTSPFSGKTKDGLGIGSSKEMILKKYGEPDNTSSQEDRAIFAEKGIGFLFEKEKVTVIALFRWPIPSYSRKASSTKTVKDVLRPGSGVRGLLVGISKNRELFERLGPSDLVEEEADQVIYHYYQLGLIATVAKENQKLESILAVAPFGGKTDAGIRIGSPVEDIQQFHPKAKSGYLSYSDPEEGIRFWLKKGKIVGIQIEETD